ncbi:MAG: DUF6452 family protein, partial [Cyclobacteriaceae bacterium]
TIGILFYLTILLGFTHCNEIRDCQLADETDSAVFALFDLDTTSVAKTLEFSEITIKDLEIPILNFDTTLSTFALPIDNYDTTVTYYFNSELGRDTLVLDYVSQYYIYYEECDPAQRFFGLEIRSHTFDSVSIVNRELNNDIIRNIEVFVD